MRADAPDAAFPAGSYRRFGGELPDGCDPRTPDPVAEPPGTLAFSHGRAALAWLIARRGPFATALVAAYTCPSVPRFLCASGLAVDRFDIGADADAITALAARHRSGRVLTLIPALLGFAPWLDAAGLAERLGPRALVVIDAAQTAFGHRDFTPPPGGAVLSGPRKTTALADGACLRLDPAGAPGPETELAAEVAALPEAHAAIPAKRAARALFARRDPALEPQALALAAEAEAGWPDQPCRMSDRSRRELATLDAHAHAALRQTNREHLRRWLEPLLPSAMDGAGVPFGHAVLCDQRAELLRHLRAHRVFATPLWPDAELDPARHPRAADLAQRLLVLPVDQRYRPDDMALLGRLVLDSLMQQRPE